jgi:hypothetical protein
MGHPLLSSAQLRWQLALLIVFCCGVARGADIYVVTSELNLSAAEIREVYRGEKEFSGEIRIVPVDNLSAQAAFLAKVLSMTEERYTALWVRKAFRDGLNPPPAKATDAEVRAFVKQTRGAVGYVSSPPRDKELRVVGKY